MIRDHLVAVAPTGPMDGGWDGVRVEVEAVEEVESEAGAFTVRFRAFRDDGAGKGPVHDVVLARHGEGWRVARYGPSLRESVAVMVAWHRKAEYGELVEALISVQDTAAHVYRSWSRPRKFAGRDAADTVRTRVLQEELLEGIPAALLRAELSSRHPGLGEGLAWGVTDEVAGEGAEVVWVARQDHPGERCAQLLSPAGPPPEWSWVEGRFVTCRGRAGRYVERPRPLEVLEEIDAAGGALVP